MDLPRIEPRELRRLAAGDSRALERVYRALGDRVYRTALHMLGQAADAEDATQEIFLAIPNKVKSYRAEAAFSNWIYRVTVNHCLSRITRGPTDRAQAAPEGEESLVDPALQPDEALCIREQGLRMRELLLRLPAEHRSVLVLREIEDLSYREIAETLDLPEGTVMSRLSRARAGLRRLLDPEYSYRSVE